MKHKVKRIHFVGIGGAGMCGIAEVLLNLGFDVSGSDLGESAVTSRLREAGAMVFFGHDAGYQQHADVVVTSTAVKADNPEVLAARARQVPVIPRAMMLAELLRFRQGIAVAGTHGKTTTTSLIASILAEAGLDPTYVIGGKLTAAGSNAKLGSGDFIVVEADESDASFLMLKPVLAVVTNIDADHMDTYGHDFVKLKQAFLDFLSHLPFYGRAALCIDDPNVRAILPMVSKPVTTYGVSADATLRAENIVALPGGRMRFDAVWKNGIEYRIEITLNAAGHHNVLNSLAAIAVGLEVGASETAIQKALNDFGGVGRRFQHYGDTSLPQGGSVTVIDDYGHHPVEMAATLAAVRGAYPERRLLLAFQPHRYSRTRDCFEDFARVLSTTDALVLTEVYAAGESPIIAADGRALTRAVRVHGKVEPLFVEDVADLSAAILEHARDGDVIITMGAGSIGGIPAKLVTKA
ncbi:UDP-N-acetylmuramate--L-alanine ligase [Chitinimonas sp. BJB300]|uniref:UDP-N-acetylmuramate--L-alanine ligase n=1 Tax=Chitinimonas sp. BJB300 TaxID=1559339 RepID=UPI000C11CC79|nr:UDP-N-acetylmuramate--L-alanine ligase [Chitinimonas sp. BJB300]PHV12773.1 UDP-N-acetylmuramate--L-alanine ligase [Chitinimonas sp. BJB300]TSJ91357.1 UDP-N-acetylmuramate--L-alanine ligase [Chitinimonas sp. BJB300]